MAITAITMVTRALRLINGIESGEAPDAALASDATAYLNEMVNSWENEGIHINWVNVAQGQELCVHDKYLEGIRFNLAVRLGVEIDGEDAPLSVQREADRLKSAIRMSTFEYDDDMEVDRALHPRYFTRRVGAYDVDEG